MRSLIIVFFCLLTLTGWSQPDPFKVLSDKYQMHEINAETYIDQKVKYYFERSRINLSYFPDTTLDPPVCYTYFRAELTSYSDSLSPLLNQKIATLLTDNTNYNTDYNNGIFRIHYDNMNPDLQQLSLNGKPLLAELFLQCLMESYELYFNQQGFKRPIDSQGGDGFLNIFIGPGNGARNTSSPPLPVIGSEWSVITFGSKLGKTGRETSDPDSIGGIGLGEIRIACAHELKHLSQAVSTHHSEQGLTDEIAWMEADATFGGELIYPNANEHVVLHGGYRPSIITSPGTSLFTVRKFGSGYGAWPWPLFIWEKFDNRNRDKPLIYSKEIWEQRSLTLKEIDFQSYNQSFIKLGHEDFYAIFGEFRMWTYFTNRRTVAGFGFKDSELFDLLPVYRAIGSEGTYSCSLEYFSSAFFSLIPNSVFPNGAPVTIRNGNHFMTYGLRSGNDITFRTIYPSESVDLILADELVICLTNIATPNKTSDFQIVRKAGVSLASFSNVVNNSNAGGKLKLSNDPEEILSGGYRRLNNGVEYTIQTLNPFFFNLNNQGLDFRHHEWDSKPEKFQTNFSFELTNDRNIVANFKKILTVSIFGESGDLPSIPLTISFQDPWTAQNQTTYSPVSGSRQVFIGERRNSENPLIPYYQIKSDRVVAGTGAASGLQFYFLNWSSTGTEPLVSAQYAAQPVVFTTAGATVTATYKAVLTSPLANWSKSELPFSGNGTSSVVYYSTDPSCQTGLWLHQESGTGTREINLGADAYTDFFSPPPVSVAVCDYNRQKTYAGYINISNDRKSVSVREIINGCETGFTQNLAYNTTPNSTDKDPVVQSLTPKAKLYLSGALTNYGTPFPAHANYFVLTVIDSSFIYTKTANLNPGTGMIESWSGWSTSVNPYKPKFVSNGKASYLVWLESGSVKCLRYKPGTNWGNRYTLYSNGPFYDFAAAVSPTDDLVLMMKRINSGGPALCTGKFYVNGSTMPLTVLETTTTGNYLTHSLAAEGTKLLSVVGKMPSAGQPYTYYLWKHNGSSWSKDVSGTSTPKKLLHNEVDVTAYEFATSTTPALYALKTTPVSWGPIMEKVDQETGLSVVAARLGDTLTWYTTVDPESVDSMLVDTTGLWHIVVKPGEARDILISGLNRFGSAVWVDSSRTVQFTPAEARYTFWVVDPSGNKMRYAKDQADPEETEFKLEDQVSVFPNPFNPATVFSVTVAEPSRVKLHIYNVIGQQVAEIVNTDLTAGVHDYRLNAGSWASGTYFYRLQIGDKLKSGKIQLVK